MEIRRKAIKRAKRNVVSRFLHAKNDKEMITSWKADLSGILHVFNVRLIVSVQLLLTICSQTELAINTHHNVVNTHHMVSEIHRNMVKTQEGTYDQYQSVSSVHPLSYHQINNSHHCLDSS